MQHDGSARQHQNQHKRNNQTICSDLYFCPGPQTHGRHSPAMASWRLREERSGQPRGQLKAQGGRSGQPNCRGCGGAKATLRNCHIFPFPPILSSFSPPPHQEAYFSAQEQIKALHPASHLSSRGTSLRDHCKGLSHPLQWTPSAASRQKQCLFPLFHLPVWFSLLWFSELEVSGWFAKREGKQAIPMLEWLYSETPSWKAWLNIWEVF